MIPLFRGAGAITVMSYERHGVSNHRQCLCLGYRHRVISPWYRLGPPNCKINNGLQTATSREHSSFDGCNIIFLSCNITQCNEFIHTCGNGLIRFRKLAYMYEIKCFSSLLSDPGFTKPCSVSPDLEGCYGGLFFCNIIARLLYVAVTYGSLKEVIVSFE